MAVPDDVDAACSEPGEFPADFARLIVDSAPTAIVATDCAGLIRCFNPAAERLLGWRAEDVVGRLTLGALMMPDELERLCAWMAQAAGRPMQPGPALFATLAERDEGNERRVQLRHRDGHGVQVRCSAARMIAGDGRVVGVVARARHIAEQLASTRKELELSQRLEAIAALVPGAIYQLVTRPDGSFSMPYASPGIERLHNVDRRALRTDASPLVQTVDERDREQVVDTIVQAMLSMQPWTQQYRVRAEDGSVRWLRNQSNPVQQPDGSVLWHGYVSDVTEIRRAEQALAEGEARYRQLFEANPQPMWVYDAATLRFLMVNEAAVQKYGYSREQFLAMTIADVRPLEDVPRLIEHARQPRSRSVRSAGWRHRRSDGAIFPVEIASHPIELGGRDAVLVLAHDITERKQAEAAIQQLAFYDPLTRLPNRRLLLDRLERARGDSGRSGQYGAVLFIDLDAFKTINDTKGHGAGDRLLAEIAGRVASCVRTDDTVARMGGDEFVVLLEGLGDALGAACSTAKALAERILEAIRQPLWIDGSEYHNGASLGVCLFGNDAAGGEDPLKHADAAMYRAKSSGRNTLCFYDPAMQRALESRASLESDLRCAVAHDALEVYYQPQLDADGSICGVEALLRWQHPQHGWISPLEFIPLAEETGLIVPIGYRVLETVSAQLARWSARPPTARLRVAVNVSARQFRHADFGEQVQAILSRAGADPALLTLELTESHLLDHIDGADQKMRQLRALGIEFSLDDFGTGYSSLAYLRRLPLGELKIDRSFVRDVHRDPSDAAIVQTIIAMARTLGLRTLAEGVETVEQLEFLRRHRCQAFQGFLFGRPMPIGQLEEWIAQRLRTTTDGRPRSASLSTVVATP